GGKQDAGTTGATSGTTGTTGGKQDAGTTGGTGTSSTGTGSTGTGSSGTTTGGVSSDGGRDAAPDAPVDSGAPDAAVEAEAGPAGPTLAGYQHAIDVAACGQLSACCNSANFDAAQCTQSLDANFGFLNMGAYLQLYSGNFTNAHFVFDQ